MEKRLFKKKLLPPPTTSSCKSIWFSGDYYRIYIWDLKQNRWFEPSTQLCSIITKDNICDYCNKNKSNIRVEKYGYLMDKKTQRYCCWECYKCVIKDIRSIIVYVDTFSKNMNLFVSYYMRHFGFESFDIRSIKVVLGVYKKRRMISNLSNNQWNYIITFL